RPGQPTAPAGTHGVRLHGCLGGGHWRRAPVGIQNRAPDVEKVVISNRIGSSSGQTAYQNSGTCGVDDIIFDLIALPRATAVWISANTVHVNTRLIAAIDRVVMNRVVVTAHFNAIEYVSSGYLVPRNAIAVRGSGLVITDHGDAKLRISHSIGMDAHTARGEDENAAGRVSWSIDRVRRPDVIDSHVLHDLTRGPESHLNPILSRTCSRSL